MCVRTFSHTGKFTSLATNLTRDKDTRFTENHTTYTEKSAAYTAWIDSESAYREAEVRVWSVT